jgi:plasmid stabilization system protein ParE
VGSPPMGCSTESVSAQNACGHLADDPASGRVFHAIPAYWRIEQGRHVVFFRRAVNGDVLVVRILHDRMLPELHLLGESDEEPG